jgi:GNAT superfamily N-acetyltransferase
MISNLADVPHFADVVAERGWSAWWRESGRTVSDYRAGLAPMLANTGIPFCLVDHIGNAYRGSCLVIENDLDERPELTPWIAALWVDSAHRRQGIAEALMIAAFTRIKALDLPKAYLCALPKVSPYYVARGWMQIESDVDGLNIFEMKTCE